MERRANLTKAEREKRINKRRALLRTIGIKQGSLSRSLDTAWRSCGRMLQRAAVQGDDIALEEALLLLQARSSDIIKEGLAFAVTLAYDSLEIDEEYTDSADKSDRSSFLFWLPVLLLYIDNLRKEIAWFRRQGFPDSELSMYLNGPLSYLIGKGQSTADFRQSVNVGGGRNYQVKKDFTKLLGYAMNSAFNEELHKKMQERKVVAYVGFRNGDYPCPECDDYEGRLMPITEMVYPLHINCICGWYELYDDEVLSM